eukprot:306027-Prorocentrum_minimum.AAC.3
MEGRAARLRATRKAGAHLRAVPPLCQGGHGERLHVHGVDELPPPAGVAHTRLVLQLLLYLL